MKLFPSSSRPRAQVITSPPGSAELAYHFVVPLREEANMLLNVAFLLLAAISLQIGPGRLFLAVRSFMFMANWARSSVLIMISIDPTFDRCQLLYNVDIASALYLTIVLCSVSTDIVQQIVNLVNLSILLITLKSEQKQQSVCVKPYPSARIYN